MEQQNLVLSSSGPRLEKIVGDAVKKRTDLCIN